MRYQNINLTMGLSVTVKDTTLKPKKKRRHSRRSYMPGHRFTRKVPMINKTNVTDNIAIIIEHKKVIVETALDYDISITFSNKEKEPTLDENGDLFEPVYESKVLVTPKNPMSYIYLSQVKDELKDLQEIKKFFEFVISNEKNIFETAGYKGALE